MNGCVFCNLPQDRIVSECSLTITVLDGYPVSTGHTLVIPKRHFPSYFDATEEELIAINRALKHQEKTLSKAHAPDGFNIGVNSGCDAGQTVPHLHVHLIPRYQGDVEDPRGGVRWVLPAHANYWGDA